MAKSYNIKWRQKDVESLNKAVRNFNQKVRRLKKKNPSKAQHYPETISIKDVRSKIRTRQDFNREVKKIGRFSRRGIEEIVTTDKGLTVTKYELREASIMRRVINLKRKREAERLGLTMEAGLKTQVKKQSLTPKRDVKQVAQKDFKAYVQSLEKEISSTFDKAMQENYVENYMQGLFNALGEKAFPIFEMIEQLPADVIVDQSISNPFLTIAFMYDPLEQEDIANAMLEEWQAVIDKYA